MVSIVKGSKTLSVTRSAYDNFYKRNGWGLSEGYSESSESGDEWDDVLNEENEKSLSEMNNAELREKAEAMGIDITGLTSNKQIRERIRSYTS